MESDLDLVEDMAVQTTCITCSRMNNPGIGISPSGEVEVVTEDGVTTITMAADEEEEETPDADEETETTEEEEEEMVETEATKVPTRAWIRIPPAGTVLKNRKTCCLNKMRTPEAHARLVRCVVWVFLMSIVALIIISVSASIPLIWIRSRNMPPTSHVIVSSKRTPSSKPPSTPPSKMSWPEWSSMRSLKSVDNFSIMPLSSKNEDEEYGSEERELEMRVMPEGGEMSIAGLRRRVDADYRPTDDEEVMRRVNLTVQSVGKIAEVMTQRDLTTEEPLSERKKARNRLLKKVKEIKDQNKKRGMQLSRMDTKFKDMPKIPKPIKKVKIEEKRKDEGKITNRTQVLKVIQSSNSSSPKSHIKLRESVRNVTLKPVMPKRVEKVKEPKVQFDPVKEMKKDAPQVHQDIVEGKELPQMREVKDLANYFLEILEKPEETTESMSDPVSTEVENFRLTLNVQTIPYGWSKSQGVMFSTWTMFPNACYGPFSTSGVILPSSEVEMETIEGVACLVYVGENQRMDECEFQRKGPKTAGTVLTVGRWAANPVGVCPPIGYYPSAQVAECGMKPCEWYGNYSCQDSMLVRKLCKLTVANPGKVWTLQGVIETNTQATVPPISNIMYDSDGELAPAVFGTGQVSCNKRLAKFFLKSDEKGNLAKCDGKGAYSLYPLKEGIKIEMMSTGLHRTNERIVIFVTAPSFSEVIIGDKDKFIMPASLISHMNPSILISIKTAERKIKIDIPSVNYHQEFDRGRVVKKYQMIPGNHECGWKEEDLLCQRVTESDVVYLVPCSPEKCLPFKVIETDRVQRSYEAGIYVELLHWEKLGLNMSTEPLECTDSICVNKYKVVGAYRYCMEALCSPWLVSDLWSCVFAKDCITRDVFVKEKVGWIIGVVILVLVIVIIIIFLCRKKIRWCCRYCPCCAKCYALKDKPVVVKINAAVKKVKSNVKESNKRLAEQYKARLQSGGGPAIPKSWCIILCVSLCWNSVLGATPAKDNFEPWFAVAMVLIPIVIPIMVIVMWYFDTLIKKCERCIYAKSEEEEEEEEGFPTITVYADRDEFILRPEGMELLNMDTDQMQKDYKTFIEQGGKPIESEKLEPYILNEDLEGPLSEVHMDMLASQKRGVEYRKIMRNPDSEDSIREPILNRLLRIHGLSVILLLGVIFSLLGGGNCCTHEGNMDQFNLTCGSGSKLYLNVTQQMTVRHYPNLKIIDELFMKDIRKYLCDSDSNCMLMMMRGKFLIAAKVPSVTPYGKLEGLIADLVPERYSSLTKGIHALVDIVWAMVISYFSHPVFGMIYLLTNSVAYLEQTSTFTLPLQTTACTNFTVGTIVFNVCVEKRIDIYTSQHIFGIASCKPSVEMLNACGWQPKCSTSTKICWVDTGNDCEMCSNDLKHNGGPCFSVRYANHRRYTYDMQKLSGNIGSYENVAYLKTEVTMTLGGQSYTFRPDQVMNMGGVTLRPVVAVPVLSFVNSKLVYFGGQYWVPNAGYEPHKTGPYWCTCQDKECKTLSWDKNEAQAEIRTTGSLSTPKPLETYFNAASKYFSMLDSQLPAGCVMVKNATNMELHDCTGGMMSFEITVKDSILAKAVLAKVRSFEVLSANCTDYYGTAIMKLKVASTQGSAPLTASVRCRPDTVYLKDGIGEIIIHCETKSGSLEITLRLGDIERKTTVKCIVSEVLSEGLRTYEQHLVSKEQPKSWFEQLKDKYGAIAAGFIAFGVAVACVIGGALLIWLTITIVKFVIALKTSKSGGKSD